MIDPRRLITKPEHAELYQTSPCFKNAINLLARTLDYQLDAVAAAAKEQDAMFEQLSREGLWSWPTKVAVGVERARG